MIDLSVVVPVYNGETFITRTIGELIDYLASLDEAAELIVVDDGSTDHTAKLIDEVVADAPVSVHFEKSPRNEGKGAAITRGMAVARGRYRVFLDADLAYAPQAIGEIRTCLEKDFPWDGEGIPTLVVYFAKEDGKIVPALVG